MAGREPVAEGGSMIEVNGKKYIKVVQPEGAKGCTGCAAFDPDLPGTLPLCHQLPNDCLDAVHIFEEVPNA